MFNIYIYNYIYIYKYLYSIIYVYDIPKLQGTPDFRGISKKRWDARNSASPVVKPPTEPNGHLAAIRFFLHAYDILYTSTCIYNITNDKYIDIHDYIYMYEIDVDPCLYVI